MAKALLQDQSANDLQNIIDDTNPDQTTEKGAINSGCQSMSPFLAASHDIALPHPSITGRAENPPPVQYALLFDDRTSDPPRHHG